MNRERAAGRQRILAVAAGVLFFVGTGLAQEITEVAEAFSSARKQIQVERYSPTDSTRHPAVLVLYGASGLTARADSLRQYARSLAQHGYVAFLVHYFDASGSATAGELPVKPERFRIWTKAIEDGVTFASHDPLTDSRRIGILCLSLGAFLGVWEASQDPRIRAVVEYYGGTDMFLGPARRMPATLILHGEKDSFVSVDQAYQLERLLQAHHAPYEIKIYPGVEHGFDGPDGDQAASTDAWNRTLAFLEKHLAGH